MTANESTNRRGSALDILADRISDAYSFDRYGVTGWRACVRMLSRRGFNDREIEAIMRSKWTRWAADSAKNYRQPNSADLARFIDGLDNLAAQVAELVNGTF